MIFAFTSLILFSLNSADNETPIVKTFPEYSCKLVLPSPAFKWIEQDVLSDSLAGFHDDIGTKLLLTAKKIPDGVILNDSLIKEIQRPFNQHDSISILNGEMITFRKVPCFQFHIRYAEDNSIGTIRIFIANNYFYELQLTHHLPIDDSNKLENAFSLFEFIDTPNIPLPNSHSPKKKPNNIARILVRVIFFIIVIVGVLLAVARNANRK